MADKIIMRPVEALIPYARNARTHSEDQVAQIGGSGTFRDFGDKRKCCASPVC